MKFRLPHIERSPKQKALAGLAVGVVGIAVGMFVMIPVHETYGTLWTMLFAIVAGIYYTRLNQIKKK